MARELTVEHGLHERAHRQAVGRSDEVDRAPHHDDADDGAVDEESRQLVGPELLQAGPQAEVRVRRELRLHAHQMLDRVQRRSAGPLEQELAGEGGAVELAAGEPVRCHAGGFWPTESVGSPP